MVGIYYYLRPVIAMYFSPAEPGTAPIEVDSFQSITLVILVLITLALGILPGLVSGLL
jgi:NADH-quinone oxidoreductase subunit N